MKTLYIDCAMGAAGDMLTAALLELLPDRAGFLERLNGLGIPGVRYEAIPTVKCGITGTRVAVTVHGAEEEDVPYHHDHEHDHEHEHHHDHDHHHDHHHSGMHDIAHLVRDHMDLPAAVQDDVLAVYDLIAQAESHVHGVPVTDIHFHEVGTLDAVADVTAACLLLHELAPDEIVVSPVHVGSGQVRCAHGLLPVPAPATAYILQGVPIYGGTIAGELCTPTGAALLKHFASRFGPMPPMRTAAIGYGMGKRDFGEACNCVRALLGETDSAADRVLELACNLDDMTAEAIGFAMDRLLAGGALDVWTSPIGMKKSRPGTLLQVLCRPADREAMLALLFKHTTTLGVREAVLDRYTLDRREDTVDGPCGPVRRKVSAGYGVTRTKYEYDDLARLAAEKDISLDAARALVEGR